jgi:hypothetical protein
MVEAKIDGHQSDGGFKQSGWNIIFKAVNDASGNFPLELKHVKSKYSNANRIWKLWEAHEKSCISGWTRREDGALVNDTEVEEDYFSKHNDRKRFRRKAPRYLQEMIEVFGDRVATGRSAITLEDAINNDPDEDTEGDSQVEEDEEGQPRQSQPRQSQPRQSQPPQSQPVENNGNGQSKKGKQKASQSLSLRKRAASNSVTPRAKKTTSSTRELAGGLLDTNNTLKKLGNRVAQIIEGITPIERAMKLLRDEIPELSFRDKMRASEKLDQGNTAAIFCSLAKEERREWVKDIVPWLDALPEQEGTDGGEEYHGDIDLDDL